MRDRAVHLKGRNRTGFPSSLLTGFLREGAAMKEKRLFHYTVGIRLEEIIYNGVILPATKYIDKGERPAVWLTFEEEWPNVCNKSLMDAFGNIHKGTMQSTEANAEGLYRIEVSKGLPWVHWQGWANVSGVSKKTVRRLAEVSPNKHLWRIVFDSIKRKDWIAIEKFNNGEWVVFDANIV